MNPSFLTHRANIRSYNLDHDQMVLLEINNQDCFGKEN